MQILALTPWRDDLGIGRYIALSGRLGPESRVMCGRFTNRLTWREIVALYRLAVPVAPERNLPARYNICPTDIINAVIEREGRRELVPMRWGLVPWWWKKTTKETPATFNARAKTVADKPMFRDAFKRTRLIPASGYYEWLNTPTGKQPYYYTVRDASQLTFAGLWDQWKKHRNWRAIKVVHHNNRKMCRMHGARGGAPEGKRNGNYKHGARSKETIELRKLIKSFR